jgi:hypothetical protein
VVLRVLSFHILSRQRPGSPERIGNGGLPVLLRKIAAHDPSD